MSDDALPAQQPVLVVMGVTGAGKSTIAGILAGQLGGTSPKATTFTRSERREDVRRNTTDR